MAGRADQFGANGCSGSVSGLSLLDTTGERISREALPYGWRLVLLQETDSTNLEIRRRRETDPGEGLAVVAARQTQGRGRRGRQWASPEGNLYVSIRLDSRPGGLATAAQLSFVAAVALADALRDVAPHVPIRCKWPNDLLVNGAKISGILLESDDPYVILGIGVNVAWSPPPGEALYAATNLRSEGAVVTPEGLAATLCRHLAACTQLWRDAGFAPIRAAWLEMAQGRGQQVVARLQDGTEQQGEFVDLDADGALVLQSNTGRSRIMAADVFFSAPKA